MTDELRAKFEAHFTPPPYEWTFTRYGKDSSWPHLYRHYDVQCAWEGWQAAHASRNTEVEALKRKSFALDALVAAGFVSEAKLAESLSIADAAMAK